MGNLEFSLGWLWVLGARCIMEWNQYGCTDRPYYYGAHLSETFYLLSSEHIFHDPIEVRALYKQNCKAQEGLGIAQAFLFYQVHGSIEEIETSPVWPTPSTSWSLNSGSQLLALYGELNKLRESSMLWLKRWERLGQRRLKLWPTLYNTLVDVKKKGQTLLSRWNALVEVLSVYWGTIAKARICSIQFIFKRGLQWVVKDSSFELLCQTFKRRSTLYHRVSIQETK